MTGTFSSTPTTEDGKHVVLHVFSGDNPQHWERQLSTANTEVLCVDVQGGCHANLLDKHVYGFLLTIARLANCELYLVDLRVVRCQL